VLGSVNAAAAAVRRCSLRLRAARSIDLACALRCSGAPERAESETTMLKIYEIALWLLRKLRPTVEAIEMRDRD
jgi:hypothetical protein